MSLTKDELDVPPTLVTESVKSNVEKPQSESVKVKITEKKLKRRTTKMTMVFKQERKI